MFIPSQTWINVKNAGTETARVVFVFSAPGFEDYMRCESVLPNEKTGADFPTKRQRVRAPRACHLQEPGKQTPKGKLEMLQLEVLPVAGFR